MASGDQKFGETLCESFSIEFRRRNAASSRCGPGQYGRSCSAIAAFREALRLDPNEHQAWRNLGAVLKGMAPPGERIACYERALSIADDPYTRANLAAALLDAGEYQAGIEQARAALAVLPGYLPAWINLGHGLAFSGQLQAAEQTYRQALNLAPEDADLLHGLGALLAAMQRYEEAAEVMARAEAIRPDDHKIGAVAARARQQVADWSRFERDVSDLGRWADERRVGLPPFNLLSLPGITAQTQRTNAAAQRRLSRAFFSPSASHRHCQATHACVSAT